MPQSNDHCMDHTGCTARIDHVESSDEKQWETIDAIRTRQNQIYGGVIIALILLIVNLAATMTEKKIETRIVTTAPAAVASTHKGE